MELILVAEITMDRSRTTPKKNKVETFNMAFDRPEEAFDSGKSMTGKVHLVLKEAMRVTRTYTV